MNKTKSARKSFFVIVRWLAAPMFSCLTAAILVYGTFDVYRQHTMQKEREAERTREREAVAEIEKLGGLISHEGRPPDHRVTTISLVGIIEIVDGKTVITESAITDEDLQHLRVLTKLKKVRLSADGFTNAGLEHLQGLTELQSLSINNSQITNDGLEPLKELTSLETLNLTGTSVTEGGVEELQRSLPDCTITFARKKTPPDSDGS